MKYKKNGGEREIKFSKLNANKEKFSVVVTQSSSHSKVRKPIFQSRKQAVRSLHGFGAK